LNYLTLVHLIIFPSYYDTFTTFEFILSYPLHTVNKELFCAKRKKEVVLNLLNNIGISQLCLTKVLYSLEVEYRYTLVLIGHLDEMGFTTTFSNEKSIIHNDGDTQVIEISEDRNGLYKIVYEAEVNIIKDILIIDKIYQHFGYIASATVRKLI